MRIRFILIAAVVAAAGAVHAGGGGGSERPPSLAELDTRTQALKSDILELQARLLGLKRAIRYPARNRWTVFVVGSPKVSIKLKRITLKVDGELLATEEYSHQERRALRQGGADRLYIGTLAPGRHHATVILAAKRDGETYRRAQRFVVAKPMGPRIMALRIQPRVATASGESHGPGVVPVHLDDQA